MDDFNRELYEEFKPILKYCFLGFLVLIVLGSVLDYFEYQAVKKHFPEMTYSEFIFLGDKIIINSK